ncbi:uncharacterized acetyltransferase At3g50280-like [Neltuma alba]|uniref:uncharacterized acetyltransferase At3g50280-like n=1 Tax=Neltuma alba TaxID=207710 RepID=UPI0010A59AC3|nr:uncharacterized acetyltransferase At3g50280-like [Prosopis alba]
MAGIRVVSTTTIQARSQINNGDSLKEIELNPWDLQFLLSEYGQKAVLFHQPTLSSSSYIRKTIQHLKDSLSSSLDFYPPLAGHIIESPYVPPFVHSFFPLYRSKNIEGSRIPLLAVQVTELVDGIFMACSINHCLADVKPFWDFLNTWANISRHGLNHIESNSKLASFKRWFPQGKIARPVRIPLREIMESDGKLKGSIGSHQAFPFSQRIFHFTSEKIVELTKKANLEVEMVSSAQNLLLASSYQSRLEIYDQKPAS